MPLVREISNILPVKFFSHVFPISVIILSLLSLLLSVIIIIIIIVSIATAIIIVIISVIKKNDRSEIEVIKMNGAVGEDGIVAN